MRDGVRFLPVGNKPGEDLANGSAIVLAEAARPCMSVAKTLVIHRVFRRSVIKQSNEPSTTKTRTYRP
jgi:hypothetical protein